MGAIVPPTGDQLDAIVAAYNGPDAGYAPAPAIIIGYAGVSDGVPFSDIYLSGSILNQREQPLALSADTPFEIASVTKTFTATLYQYLLARWPLGAPVVGEFPLGIGEQFGPIPLFTLMNYTSGLPADNDVATDFPRFLPRPYAIPAMLGYLNFTGLQPAAPGQSYEYSNLGFALMAAIAPLFGGNGVAFEDQVAQLIFGPVGMDSTRFFDDVRLDQLPLGYEYDGTTGTAVAAGWEFFPAYNGAGGIVSTPNDMLKWLRFNMGQANIPALTPLLPALQWRSTDVAPWPGYGLASGWFLTEATSPIPYASVWKDGDLQGFSSFMAFVQGSDPLDPVSQAGVFVLTNSGNINDSYGNELCSSISYAVLNAMNQVPASLGAVPGGRRHARAGA